MKKAVDNIIHGRGSVGVNARSKVVLLVNFVTAVAARRVGKIGPNFYLGAAFVAVVGFW